MERGICGGAVCARTPTYTGPLLAVDLFSVESMHVTVWDHKNQKVQIDNQAGLVQYISLFKSNEKNLDFNQCTYTSIITYIEFSICAQLVIFSLGARLSR